MALVASHGAPPPAQRRLRRLAVHGRRCPDCAGPLAFGEGRSLCPVCGRTDAAGD